MLPSVAPPSSYFIFSGSEAIGQMHRYGYLDKSCYIIPKHFMEHEDLSIRKHDGTKICNLSDSDVKKADGIDLAVVNHRIIKEHIKVINIGNFEKRYQPHINIMRNGKWYTSVGSSQVDPNTHLSSNQEALYFCATQEGDCGAAVLFSDNAYGMHVGTKGDLAGNLFLRFNAHVISEIVTLESFF